MPGRWPKKLKTFLAKKKGREKAGKQEEEAPGKEEPEDQQGEATGEGEVGSVFPVAEQEEKGSDCTGVDQAERRFQPLTADDQRELASLFKHDDDDDVVVVEPVQDSNEHTNVPLGAPVTISSVEGDGNCFCRCISQIIFGSQHYYSRIRECTINHMKTWSEDFCSQVLGTSVDQYLQQVDKDGRRPADDHAWATEYTVYATASLLGRNIWVYADMTCKATSEVKQTCP